MLFALICCATAFTARGARPQDGSQPTPTPPSQQADRPPWARKSKNSSNNNSTDSSKASGSTTNTSSTASTNPPPIVQPIPADDPPTEQQQRGRIRVNVQLVNVLTSVLDEHNRPAIDLPRESFHIFEEGVEQKIEVFEAETQQPLDLALMIDASLSAHKEIAFEQEASARFIRQILHAGDRLAVYSVGEDVVQLAGFSDNVGTLESAVHKMPAGSGTSLYDAILLGSRQLERRAEDRRRVIILVTDAGETTSYTDFDAARKAAVKSGALLYTIVVRPVKNESGRNTAGEHALDTITDTMGGAMFYPDQIQELDSIFDRINRELRTQYRLGYYPEPRGAANTYRTIQVNVDGNYQVRHRKTYLTGPQ
ncbi:MAG: VWA domain-containing protein [Acidobacteria bacterium]|nr:VWA domain-containing protein [Acidobacteriota bacterium]